jgi:hypothetical protein
MKVHICVLVVMFVFACATIECTFAQTSNEATTTASSTPEGGGFFDDVIENVRDIRAGINERITGEERRAMLSERTQTRIVNLAANISNRFDGLIDRLEQISERLQQRIEKQRADGYDVSVAEAALVRAGAALAIAKDELAAIDEAVHDAVRSTDPKGAWPAVRQTFIRARDAIKTAHAELRVTISALKAAPAAAPSETATTSTTSTTTYL